MAKLKLKLEENMEGQFFVDSTCINCGTCRKFAPVNLGATGDCVCKKTASKCE